MKLLSNRDIHLTPSGIVHTLFFVGLIGMAISLVTQHWLIFFAFTALPITLLTLLFAIEKPIFSYALYGIIACYFSAIYRYGEVEGLSGILDIFLIFCAFSILINVISNRNSYIWTLGFNIFTVTYIIWLVYCILILLTPHAKVNDLIAYRGVFIGTPLCYFISAILLCSTKKLKITLLLLCLFVLTAACKLYWQKTHGWDSVELRWLVNGAWQTHLLQTGIRYFSFFSDAGNFGSNMGMLFTVLGITGFVSRNRIFQVVCLVAATLACIGMMMSGTRGAMIVPLGGIALYLLLSKNIKHIAIAATAGAMAFCFFYFTNIGNGNPVIHRMRTAFRPTEDASFNVRLENQKRFAYYLKDKPFGVGVGGNIVDTDQLMKLDEEYIPTDSFYVGIWVEGGIVGLCLYITLQVIVLLRCAYLILFKIKNRQLANILAALVCGVFGVWLNGYVGRGMAMNPTSFLIAVFLSFVLNGPYIDRQLKPEEKIL